MIGAVVAWHSTCHPALAPHIDRVLRSTPTWGDYLALAFEGNYVLHRWFGDYADAYAWAVRPRHRLRIVVVMADALGDLAERVAAFEASAVDWDELLAGE